MTADDGAVTVEAAMALGILVLVTAAAVAAVAAVAAAVRCTDAARELARQAARGDVDRGRVAATALAPSGAGIEVRYEGDLVVATVTARPAGPLPLRLSGAATAVVEPGLTAGGYPAPVTTPPPGPGAEAPGDPPAPGDPAATGVPPAPGDPDTTGGGP